MLCALVALALTCSAARGETFGVVVYGGTPGGVAAAVAASRQGARVLLVEQTRHVGGLTTSGLCNDEVHHMHAWSITGISREFYQRLGQKYDRPPIAEVWQRRSMNTWESKVAQQVFDEMLAEAKVEVRYGLRVAKVAKQGSRILSLELSDGSTAAGRTFIDATYEGDLMARAGVQYTFGRESVEQYREPLAGIRLGDQRVQAATRDAAGNLLPGISGTIDELVPGASDKKVQNFNFRLTLTKNRNNKVPFPKPKNYDPGRYALLGNYLAGKPETKLKDIVAYWHIGNGKFEANNQQNAVISLGHFGGQFDYPDGDYAAQDRIYQDHVDYTQGLFWFLLNDAAVPETLRKETAEWGLAKDEFADNGNWPYYLYIREARRMIGRYVMTQKDIQTDREKDDSIGLGSHYIDAHHVQRVAVDEKQFTNEGRLWTPGKVYEIPYRALTPVAQQCDNLLVPVAASFSHVAFCTFRLEPTWMTAGHAAGIAAQMAANENIAVQEVNLQKLQSQLEATKQLLRLADEPKANEGQ
jgi:hypothetical protein